MVKSNSDFRIFNTIEFLSDIGKKASVENLDVAAGETSKSLQLIARASHNHQIKWNVIEAQSEIGKISAHLGLNATTWEVAMSIGMLGIEVSDEKKLKALEFLKEIGLLACKHGKTLENAVVKQNNKNIAIKAISYIEDIGKACKLNDCQSVTRHADKCLIDLKNALRTVDKKS